MASGSAPFAPPLLEARELAALDEKIDQVLASGQNDQLEIVGYGEISCAVVWQGQAGPVVAKRMPLFAGREQVEDYRELFDDYLEALRSCGIQHLPSSVAVHPRADGSFGVYCLQPLLEAATLAANVLRSAEPESGRALFTEILSLMVAVDARPELGLDSQLSNWAVVDGQLHYLDVSTPLLRDAKDAERLDTSLLLTSLPWLLRPVVRRFMLGDILDTYYDLRSMATDLLGNLYKERCGQWIPGFLMLLNERIDPPLREEDLRRYYRNDARVWALLQSLRRLDRGWQRRVRRRSYPFLLPGDIAR